MFVRIVFLLWLANVTRASLEPQPPYHDYELAPRSLILDPPPPYYTYDLGPTPQQRYHNLAPRAVDLEESGDSEENPVLPMGSSSSSQEHDLPDGLDVDALPPNHHIYLGLPQPLDQLSNQDQSAMRLGEQPANIYGIPVEQNPVPLGHQEDDLSRSGSDLDILSHQTNDPGPPQPGYPNLNPHALGFGQLPAYFDMPPGELNLAPREFTPVPTSSFSEHELFPGGPDLDPPPPYYRYDLARAEELFHGFMAKYHRHYSPEEYLKRLEVFKENLQEMNNDNELSLLQGAAPAAGINIFADQSWAEFADGVTPLLRVRTAVVYSVLTKIMRRKGT